MARIRILVVDDSVVIRKVLTDVLAQDPGFEVIGSASDGRIALAKISALKPDLVTLDIEMPVMNGLETLAELRNSQPKLPVIMYSTLTERGAAATLEALSLGASDYATKPANTANPAEAMEAVRRELVPKIRALCGARMLPVTTALRLPAAVPQKPRPYRHGPIEVVAIGTSTGGPNALAEVLPHLPQDLPVPVVTVQHMPPVFTRMLAERLDSRCEIRVHEASGGITLSPGKVWIAAGDFHMTVKRRGLEVQLELNRDAAENFCRPSVDVLFRSVASAFGARVLAVVMTGMGSDGVLGAQRIREAGGEVIIQDEATSVVWGMPGLVRAAGLADAVYPLEQLAGEITRRVLDSQRAQTNIPARSNLELLHHER
jgi:two-component system, chemotaxis family, protein-glutamate methylesterase/glutaminase